MEDDAGAYSGFTRPAEVDSWFVFQAPALSGPKLPSTRSAEAYPA